MPEGNVRNIVRQSILVALLASVLTHRAPAQAGTSAPDTLHSGPPAPTDEENHKLLPVVEITSFLALLNGYDRVVYPNETKDGKKIFSSTFSTTWDHIRTQRWVYDPDPFNVNQFFHPYQGATMYGLARSSGHSFWTSLIHANVGSFIWKMAGETDPPSINDMITTGQAGSLLGESLYRMADLVLKNSSGTKPGRWHELAAAVISPPGGVNRRVFGERFKAKLPDTAPATSWQIRFGANLDAVARDYSAPTTLLRRDATTEFSMSYGLPGQPGYEYTRPLDYFDFQVSLLTNTSNPIENVMIRGLLVGSKTGETATASGFWGLYGTYDYISPYLFRVSSTALSLGTTQQLWIVPGLAVQGTALSGVGFGAAGSTTVIPSTPTNAAIRDYHFGVTPQALVALRLIAGHRVMFDMTAREYYVSGLGSDDAHGSETIFRGNFGVTARIIGANALGVQYVASTRDAHYGKQPNAKFTEGAVTVVYSILGGNTFSAVKEQ
jgi:hypothetical protein